MALLVLREASVAGRAEAPDGVLKRLFAEAVPKVVVWHVLTFWRHARDSRY